MTFAGGIKFEGAQALITGASAGIGTEFAKQFHALGANVLLVARRKKELDDLAAKFNALRAGSAEVFCVDLTIDKGSDGAGNHDSGGRLLGVYNLAEVIKERRIDILVNNAGFGSFGHFEKLDLEHEVRMMKLNVIAPVILAHAVVPQMKARRSGAIISLSSVAGFQALPYLATYSASKAFNLYHTLSLRYELLEFGLAVLTVCPGPTATEFQGVARIPGTMSGMRRDSVEQVVRESISALRRNKAFVVPCLKSRLLSIPCRLLPKSFTTRIAGQSLKASLPGGKWI